MASVRPPSGHAAAIACAAAPAAGGLSAGRRVVCLFGRAGCVLPVSKNDPPRACAAAVFAQKAQGCESCRSCCACAMRVALFAQALTKALQLPARPCVRSRVPNQVWLGRCRALCRSEPRTARAAGAPVWPCRGASCSSSQRARRAVRKITKHAGSALRINQGSRRCWWASWQWPDAYSKAPRARSWPASSVAARRSKGHQQARHTGHACGVGRNGTPPAPPKPAIRWL